MSGKPLFIRWERDPETHEVIAEHIQVVESKLPTLEMVDPSEQDGWIQVATATEEGAQPMKIVGQTAHGWIVEVQAPQWERDENGEPVIRKISIETGEEITDEDI